MADPSRRKKRKPKRNEHVASTEIRQQARQSAVKAAKTVAKTVTNPTRATQTSVQPRNTVSRPTASTQIKSGSNVPKKSSTSLAKANTQAKKFQPKVKITNTSAQYSDFKKSGLTYKTQEERKKQKIDYAKAYQKGKDITYLGTKQKKEATKFKDEEGKTQKLKSVNALTREEFNRMTEASRINNKKLGNLQLKGGKGRGKDIREKVGSKTAQSALKGKFATGAMQGLSYVDVFNGVGKYNKTAKKAIKKTKSSGAYLAGYGVGMAGQFALGGTNALGRSIAKTGGKAAAKSAGKKFIRNRAGELVAETPTNLVDAAKMSMDENGKIDKKEFAKWVAINTGFTGGMGGAMEGIGGAITKKQASNMKKLLAKQQAKTITEEETKQLDNVLNKLKKKANNKESISSNIAEKGIEDRRKVLTKSSNEAAGKIAEKGRAGFETATENRRAKVAAQKNYDKKAVHLENNVKQAKKTRDTLKESVDDLKALRKKDGTMAGHQQIVDRYGSVEKLDAVISRTESALKTSRQRLREVQTNLGTEKKRLQRTNAKIDKEFPVEAKAETPEVARDTGIIKEQYDAFPAEKKQRLEGIEREANEIKDEISKLENRVEKFDNDINSGKYDGNPKALEALKRQKANTERTIKERKEILNQKRESYKKVYDGTGDGGYRAIDEPIEGLNDKPRAGNTTVSNGSKKIDETVEKARKEVAEPTKVEAKQKDLGLWYRVKRAIFNDLEAFDRMANVLPKEQGELLKGRVNSMRMARSTASAKVSEGLDIFKKYGLTAKKNKEKLNDFQEYAWLKHDADVTREDPTKEFLGYQSFSRNDAGETLFALDQRMGELEAKYGDKVEFVDPKTGKKETITEIEAFQRGLVKYFDDLLDMEVDAGICTEQFAKNLRTKYPNYVPRYVQAEFDGILTQSIKDEIDIGKGLREAKGGKSDYDLVPLYDQMQAKTNAVYKRTELNRTMNLIAAAQGMDVKQLRTVAQDMKATEEETINALTDSAVFTPNPKNGKHSVWFFQNGEKKEMPISKEMFEEVRNWTGEDKLMLFQGTLAGQRIDKALNNAALRKVARGFKDLITDYSIFFGVKNHARDLETALFYTKDLKGFAKYWPKAYWAFLSPNKEGIYRQALKAYKENGGVYSQLISSGKFDTKFYHSALGGANKLNPFHWVKEMNSALETIPRLAEFMSAMETNAYKLAGKKVKGAEFEKYFKQALENKDAISESMYRAKDVTLNFDRGGWFGKTLNRGLVPFFNPSVQGLDKLARELGTSNIVRGAGGKISAEATTKAFILEAGKLAGLVGAPVALLNERFGDYYEGKVDGYGALSDYNKYAYYNFPVGDGKYLKIPRARELASMQDVVDYAFHHMKYGDGQTPGSPVFVDTKWKDIRSLAEISYNQIGPVSPLDDNLFMPGYRALKGETWYGGSVHTFEDEEKIKEGKSAQVYDENTSWLAKEFGKTDIAKKFNITPKKADNALDGYLGILYDFGISQQSSKNAAKFDAGKDDGGNLGGITTLMRSAFASQFMIDSVFQNRYKADNFNRKTVLKNDIEKLESEGKKNSKEWKEANAKLNKINNAFGYNSIQFDETSAQIYLSDGLSGKDKLKATRELAQNQTKMWQAENEGSVTSPVDPLAVVYKMRDEKGNHILPIKRMLKACSYTSKDDFGNETNSTMDAYKTYKKGGGSDKKFMNLTLASRDVNRAAGASTSFMSWRTNAFAAELNGLSNVDDVLKAYGDKNLEYSKKDAKLYKQYKGTLKSYKQSSKDITQGAYDLGLPYASKMEQWDRANALSSKHHIDREYFAQSQFHSGKDGTYYGYDAFVIKNAARCLASDKYKKNWHGKPTDEVNKFCQENKFTYKDGKHPDPKKVEAAIRKKYGDKYTDEERAAVFYEICPWADNPFGGIGDYSLKGDTGINPSSGYGGGGRGRRRGRGGRGRGGGGGNGRGNAVAVPTATKMGNYKVHDFTFKSNVNDAYRKKVKKAREDLRKKTSKVNK